MLMNMMGILLLGTAIVYWSLAPSPAAAQCGDNPQELSCVTCHDQQDPVYQKGEWHAVHARKEVCTSCHAGNCSTMDKDLAHEGLVADPLTDIYTGCHGCHPDDYATRAARFAVVLAVTPGSVATPTAVPTRQVVDHPMVILPSVPAYGPLQVSWLFVDGLAFTGLIMLVLIGLRLYSRKHNKSYP
jgi:hypothetical protein